MAATPTASSPKGGAVRMKRRLLHSGAAQLSTRHAGLLSGRHGPAWCRRSRRPQHLRQAAAAGLQFQQDQDALNHDQSAEGPPWAGQAGGVDGPTEPGGVVAVTIRDLRDPAGLQRASGPWRARDRPVPPRRLTDTELRDLGTPARSPRSKSGSSSHRPPPAAAGRCCTSTPRPCPAPTRSPSTPRRATGSASGC